MGKIFRAIFLWGKNGEHSKHFWLCSTIVAILSYPFSSYGFGSGISTCSAPLPVKESTNPVVITSCTEVVLRDAIAAGGFITFDCGAMPTTITITAPLELNISINTVLDGASLITLDGQGETRLFHKDWHDGYDITITLQNIRIINGRAPSGDKHSGGVFYGGHPGTRLHVIDSTFENNNTTDIHTADNQGGAAWFSILGRADIMNNTFTGNSTTDPGFGMGGGLCLSLGKFKLINNTFAENYAWYHGGAIQASGTADFMLQNNLFFFNASAREWAC